MADSDTYPPRYYEYLASQRRVSNWVQQTRSHPRQSSASSVEFPPRTSRAITKRTKRSAESMYALTSSSPPTRNRQRRNSAEQTAVSPAAALITSSLFVYAFLPSLLTVMAFVVVLTLVTMGTEESQDRRSKLDEADVLLS
ncbi:hypothetical protein JR316_0008514 [Psilocybe cubensis]|uniref:Uncharacterized protein n=3 Tax=Psilocybe cubensis TaxID=181762 RepID=A0A8H7XLI4_PSICU|nr:hypothetical protein JR316_0008485 [Psilocybe cubensis]XP_047747543.1 hypothetical protein JR316_0008514 [Psilocybe cubensis]KAH9479889.1 hypothetical protein JR316_0008485 [Psilocybe cubensis]KAH9479918.1 hypothetical protein JR316_0008514 [Psilocybe cubensis]